MKRADNHNFWKILAFLIITFGMTDMYAQPQSNKGRFEVDFNRGCAPLTINITELDGLGAGVSRQYDYENDSIFVNNLNHTYTAPGNYQIVQLINVDTLSDKLDTIQITVLDSPDPEYSVFNCKNNTVSVDISNESYYDSLEIDYGDGTVIRVRTGLPVTDHVYPGLAPQSFTINVRGLLNNAADNCASVSTPVTTITNLIPPDLQSALVTLTADTGTVDVGFNLGPNVNYELRIGTNSVPPSFFTNLVNQTTITVNPLNTESNFYCYQIAAVDVCDGETILSERVCTLLLNTTAEDSQNRLDWNTLAPSGTNYRILRDGAQIHSATNITSYVDTDVVCQVNYCYTVIVDYPSGATASSNESCVTAISTTNPPAIPDITATVNGNSIEVSWDPPAGPVQEYLIFKSSNGSFFSNVARVTTNTFTDTGLRIDESTYCYRIDYLDDCGNLSLEGSQACAIRLTADEEPVIVRDFEWTEYEGWQNGISEYIVEKLDENGAVVSTESVGLLTTFTDNNIDPQAQFVAYRIRVISNDAIPLEAVSNVLEFRYEAQLFIPQAFTPNNDGLNDLLEINSIFVDQFSIKFFNRWGDQIYSSEDITEAWDGLLGNNEAPQGTYGYVAEITDFEGRTRKQAGSFVLLRN